jgi:hypothetical protein
VIPDSHFANTLYYAYSGNEIGLVVGDDGHLYRIQLSEPPSGNSTEYDSESDLTSLTNAYNIGPVNVIGNYSRVNWVSQLHTSDPYNSIFFIDAGGYLDQIVDMGSGWTFQSNFADLDMNGAFQIISSPTAYMRSDLVNAVVYSAINGSGAGSIGHIMETSRPYGGSTWSTYDLTGILHVPVAVGEPTAYQRSDQVNAVVYIANVAPNTSHHIWELSLAQGSGTWLNGDLIQAAASCGKGPAPVAEGETVIARVRADSVNVVHYLCNGGHICELWLPPGSQAWCWADLFDALPAPYKGHLTTVNPLVPGSDGVYDSVSNEVYKIYFVGKYNNYSGLASLSLANGWTFKFENVGNHISVNPSDPGYTGYYQSGGYGSMPTGMYANHQVGSTTYWVARVLFNGLDGSNKWGSVYDDFAVVPPSSPWTGLTNVLPQ